MVGTEVCNVLTYVCTYALTDACVQDDNTTPAYGWEVKRGGGRSVYVIHNNLLQPVNSKTHTVWQGVKHCKDNEAGVYDEEQDYPAQGGKADQSRKKGGEVYVQFTTRVSSNM